MLKKIEEEIIIIIIYVSQNIISYRIKLFLLKKNMDQ